MTTGVMIARNTVGIIGNVLSFFLFASPMPTMRRILRKKSVEGFQPYPYIAGVMNCIFWVFYGLPIITPNSTLVITINSIGLALELGYLVIFCMYGTNAHRIKIALFLVAEVVFTAVTAVLVLHFCHTQDLRNKVVGPMSVVFSLVLYFSPLAIMHKVIKTKSVEFMPFYLSLSAFLNGVDWSVYAFLGKFDLNILVANGLGAVFAAAQLILYYIYRKTTPKTQEGQKPPQVQMTPSQMA